MIRVDVREIQRNLSRYLDQVAAGELVIVCRHDVAVAEIRRSAPARAAPRPVGLGLALYGDFEIAGSFDEPLPDWLLLAFEGRGT